MSKYINADELMKEFIEFVTPSNLDYSIPIPTWNDAVSLLGSAPESDVVEVVRCKDCKHCWNHDNGCYECGEGFCRVNADFYCADGERKEATDNL